MTQILRVVATDGFDTEAENILKAEPGLEVQVFAGVKKEELVPKLARVDVAIIRSATHFDRELLEKSPQLRGILRAGVGIDNIDVPAATELGVYVWNAPTGNYQSTAELALGLLFAVARKISFATEAARAGKWVKKEIGVSGRQLNGLRLGIFGAGNIGLRMARMAAGIGMHVQICDPVFRRSTDAPFDHVDFETLLATSDVLTIHAPLLPATRHRFTLSEFAKMKSSALFIHAARGGIVKDADLVQALAKNLIAGAGLDVYEKEPFDPASPVYAELIKDARVVLTPHVGASTRESQRHVGLESAEKIIALHRALREPNAKAAPRPLNAPAAPRFSGLRFNE